MKRIVHLDLKGAPLKIGYLENVLYYAKSWGATGILLEWEDTFPYRGNMAHVGSQNGKEGMYTIEEVRHILNFAKGIGLEAIQLVQTISHLEFVLKHPQFKYLRELPKSPAVLCPSKPDSIALVWNMLVQVLDLQPDANYLHIGADEVWYMEACDDCKQKVASNPYKTPSLFLDYVRHLILFLKALRPNLTILMWDDMLRGVSLDILKAYNIGDLVQPVLWMYQPKECFNIDPGLWINYARVFRTVWGGSAFKGANGSCTIVSPVKRYVSNHEAWIQEITKYKVVVNIPGIILTGWSRYDHYSTLCELMPVSLPSLASCLKTLQNYLDMNSEPVVREVLPAGSWPGEEFVLCVHSFMIVRERCLSLLHGDDVTSWLNPWQLENSYTSPTQVENIANNAQTLLTNLTILHDQMLVQLDQITGERSKREWLGTFVVPLLSKMTELYQTASSKANSEASVTPSLL